MNHNWDLPRILRLIEEEVTENLNLEYKSINALKREEKCKIEISKDVSAFANSAGGIIVYGIEEKDNKPVGLSLAPSPVNREWLENVIGSNIQDRIDNLLIHAIADPNGNEIFVVEIPKSPRAPHMAKDNRYYKRQNFSSLPMEHYEIEDIRNRKISPDVSAKLITWPEIHYGKRRDRIGLFATSANNTIAEVYSVSVIVDENVNFISEMLSMINNRFYTEKIGMPTLGKLYQRIVSPSFGHPIWKGIEINLFGENDVIEYDFNGNWSEIFILSEINLPGQFAPISNKLGIFKSGGSIEYKFSHEVSF